MRAMNRGSALCHTKCQYMWKFNRTVTQRRVSTVPDTVLFKNRSELEEWAGFTIQTPLKSEDRIRNRGLLTNIREQQ